jgi:site-specific DNA recombinase
MKQLLRNVPSTTPVRICLYVRVSTDKQANKEDGSLDTQLDRLLSYVNFKKTLGENWTISEKIVEGEREGKRHGRTGKNTEREGLQKLLDLARAQLIDVVIVTKIDRISRSTIDFLQLVREIDSYGVKLVSLRENIDLTSPSGKFQTTLLIALAEHERETISVRTKEKVEWRAGKGLPIGPPPIGYRMNEKMYEIVPEYAKHVTACDRLYLQHESSEAVVREFDRLGFRTPNGNRYNLPMVCRMLRNPTYAAKIEYEGDVFDAQWKPIRAFETHKKVQAIMDGNDRRKRSLKREMKGHVYLLQSLLRCGICEHKMTPKPGTGRNGQYYPYYACTNAEKSLGQACPRRNVPAKGVDDAVMEFLKKLVLDPELVRKFVEKANDMVSETAGKLKGDLSRVKEQLAAVRSKLSNLTDLIAEGGKAAFQSIGKRMEALEKEREELEQSEGRIKKEMEAESCQILSAQEQVRTLSLFNELIDLNKDHPERIKAMLPRFVDYAVWREDETGEGNLEVALFPRPIVKAQDITLKTMLSDLVARGGLEGKRGKVSRCFVGDSQMG